MEGDRSKNAELIACANACGMKWDERVSYQITTKIDSQAKKGVMIIDEVDAPVFNDVVGFYENTKYINLKIIGLTATAFHGK